MSVLNQGDMFNYDWEIEDDDDGGNGMLRFLTNNIATTWLLW